MLTLVHAPQSRSTGFIWLLEETGQPFDIRYVSIQRRGGEGAQDPANPHPHKKVPALLHDGALVYEQAAIALYVTDAFPEAALGPRIGEPGRAAFVSLLAYYAGVVEPAFVSQFLSMQVPRGAAGWVPVAEAIDHIVSELGDKPFLLGERFSAADVLYGGTFGFFLNTPMMPDVPSLKAYAERCIARPAYARAEAKDAAPG